MNTLEDVLNRAVDIALYSIDQRKVSSARQLVLWLHQLKKVREIIDRWDISDEDKVLMLQGIMRETPYADYSGTFEQFLFSPNSTESIILR